MAYTRAKKHKTYILKPESGCQGRGIWVTKNPKDIKPHEHMLCQQYLSKVGTRCCIWEENFMEELAVAIFLYCCPSCLPVLFK